MRASIWLRASIWIRALICLRKSARSAAQFLCHDPAAARAFGSYGLAQSAQILSSPSGCRSGDFSAPALNQKNQSDGEQDACDDPDYGCVIHVLPSLY
jgi:hypothetical protein